MASQQQQAAEVLTPHTPDVSPSFALQLLDLPPTTTSAADNAAVVTSVVDRLVEVVSFRWESIFASLVCGL